MSYCLKYIQVTDESVSVCVYETLRRWYYTSVITTVDASVPHPAAADGSPATAAASATQPDPTSSTATTTTTTTTTTTAG